MLYTGANFFHIHTKILGNERYCAQPAQVRDKSQRLQRVAAVLQKKLRCLQSVKTKPASAIAEAIDAGQRQFGENYVQEGR